MVSHEVDTRHAVREAAESARRRLRHFDPALLLFLAAALVLVALVAALALVPVAVTVIVLAIGASVLKIRVTGGHDA